MRPGLQINIYNASGIFLVENLVPVQNSQQIFTESGWVLDFALGVSWALEGKNLMAGEWSLAKIDVGHRKIRGNNAGEGCFISLVISKNTYAYVDETVTAQNGWITGEMMASVLGIIYTLKTGGSAARKDIWIKSYTQILLIQTILHPSVKVSLPFHVLRKVYERCSALDTVSITSTPSDLAHSAGISVSTLQRICRVLYGQSAQKLLQAQKMKHAIRSLQTGKKSIHDISVELGYRHSPNFITAFHNHFGMTPLEALQG